MSRITTDVDIDVVNRETVLDLFECVLASIERAPGVMENHNTGVYFQPIPKDPLTNRSLIDHKKAEKLGYFKIDFLNSSLYEGIRDEAHLDNLISREPMWELLDDEIFVRGLYHIGGHYNLVKRLRPRSIEQLAALLAIIRPAKRYLESKDWDTIMNEVWERPTDGKYFFKKSHSFAYAIAIVAQINLITEELEVS